VKPTLSIVLFTVLSGAGLGALSLIALSDVVSAITGARDSWHTAMTAAATAGLALLVAGLCASTLHLANPRNAWRSLTRWRSSWLSREAVAALALLPVALVYIGLHAFEAAPRIAVAAAAAIVPLASAMLYCTAMIYASLKPIRQWHTSRVPVAFWLLAHASGALLVVCAKLAGGVIAPGWIIAAVLLFVLALIAKLEYWRFIGSADAAVTLERAIGVAHGVGPPARTGAGVRSIAARLLDVGHARGTFLTDEFVNTPADSTRRRLRALALLGGFGAPLLWLAANSGIPLPGLRVLSGDWRVGVAVFVGCLAGLAAERWLFFADARHTVRLYHGERTT
jgi:DMSO reductase anchor subunit